MCRWGHHVQPCGCDAQKVPCASTWFATGKLHFELGRPCDERLPLAYVGGWRFAAEVAKVSARRLVSAGTFDA